MSYIPIGYSEVPVAIVGTTKGHTKCDLKIPNPSAGQDLAKVLGSLEDVDTQTATAIRMLLDKIDANFAETERWAGYFFRHCVCHCEPNNE